MIPSALLFAAVMVDRPTIALSDDYVRLRDVVNVRSTAQIGDRIVARLPDGVQSVALSRSQLRALIRRAAPGIKLADIDAGSITFQRRARTAQPASCFETTVPVAKGASVSRELARAIACEPGRRAVPIAFDPARQTSVALQDLAAGDYLGSVRLSIAPAIERGASMILRSQSGPVTIERPVSALQAAGAASRRLFVATTDGTVIAAPIANEQGR